jgi:hypothetical protein
MSFTVARIAEKEKASFRRLETDRVFFEIFTSRQASRFGSGSFFFSFFFSGELGPEVSAEVEECASRIATEVSFSSSASRSFLASRSSNAATGRQLIRAATLSRLKHAETRASCFPNAAVFTMSDAMTTLQSIGSRAATGSSRPASRLLCLSVSPSNGVSVTGDLTSKGRTNASLAL